MKVTETVEVTKETREFGKAMVSLVKASKKAMADGFQPTDLGTIVSSEFQSLMQGIQGVDQMSSEEKEDTEAFAKGIGLSIGELAGVFLEKPAAPAAAPKA
jgi:hypothetical protein